MARSNGELESDIRYPGEDTRPTSRKELFGFYAYSFAAEVFIVCGIGTLQRNGMEMGDVLCQVLC